MPDNSLFKPRKFGGDVAALSKRSFLADSTLETPTVSGLGNISTYSGLELTKNDKYCVSRLPALPPVLGDNRMDDAGTVLNGYADNNTKCLLVIGEKAIIVWPYRSTDEVPISFEFPIGENNALPLALLTLPSGGATLDPGLVIINSTSGLVRFYESVQHAPALGLINSKLIEITVNIQAKLGEYITLAENVEPAGIVVATSWKRVVLILLRDYKGAPHLSTIELVSPSKASRLLSGIFGLKNNDEIGDEIVSVKSGKISNHGMAQEILVQDAKGLFRKFLFQSSANGSPYIHHTLQYRLSSYLENSIDGFVPGAIVDVKFLDIWPLRSDSEVDDLYTALVCVHNSMHGVDEKNLLLVTLRINDSGVLLHGSHQLPNVGGSADSLASKPQLFIPKPGATAFVVVGNSVILTDVNTTFLKLELSFEYYKPKWEDVVNFKPSVQIIGLGFEDKAGATSNPSVILVTKGYGVLRVERFPTDSSDSVATEEDSTDPVYLLKSHIQQAIYYHESLAVDFDVGADYPVDVVTEATKSIVSEILDSSSPYLPPFFPSTRDSLIMRATLLRELIDFVKRNFPNAWFIVVPEIVQGLEKVEVSQSLWTFVDSDTPEAALLKEKLIHIIKSNDLVSDLNSKDPARAFFTHHVSQILIVLTDLVETLFRSDYALPTINRLLVSTLSDAVFNNETAYIFGVSELPAQKLWVFDTKLLVTAEEVYSKAYCTRNKDFGENLQGRSDMIKLTETLYYLVTCAIQYMQDTEDDQLPGYLEWYNSRKGEWISALMNHGAVADALRISEKYQDFLSVAAVLEKEREQTSPEYIDDKLRYFTDKYGYPFASKLFDYYIKNDQIQRLLLEFKDYQPYIEQYFKANPRKSSQVAWIHYLLVNNFKEASNVLISLSSKKETDNQENRELNYSLAKLTAIAAKLESPESDSAVLEEIAVEAENSLVVIRIQNKLHQTVSLFLQGQKELVTLEYFLDNFINPNIAKADASEQILPFFQRFVDQMPLLKEQLITLLTVIKPASAFSGVFADALNVSALIRNDAVFKETASEVWLKLLSLTDDWAKITATSENTDEVNKLRVKETALFATLVQIHSNPDIVGVLDAVVQKARVGSGEGELANKAHTLVVSHDLALWIETIKAEAKARHTA